jgi:SAM-dependent methyltransferase
VMERWCRWAQVAKYGGAEFSDYLNWKFTFVKNIVPGAWGGTIPSITSKGRLTKLDEYVDGNPWCEPPDRGTMLDLGCGFPPWTAIETSCQFQGWLIVGADPSFPCSIVTDDTGAYANFDREDRLLHYQGGAKFALDQFHDPEAQETHFTRLLCRLRSELPDADATEFRKIERNGAELVVNPVRQYESPNVSFLRGGIGNLDIRDVDVARCFNVLMYFDQTFRDSALEWLSGVLRNGGLFICGTAGNESTECKYTVYRKEERLLVKEFACSIGTLRPVDGTVWYSYSDDDYEAILASSAAGVIRSDDAFRSTFDSRLDELLAERGLLERGDDGNLHKVGDWTYLEAEYAGIEEQLVHEGYVDGAVSILRRGGHDAWRNCVDHIVFDPRSWT